MRISYSYESKFETNEKARAAAAEANTRREWSCCEIKITEANIANTVCFTTGRKVQPVFTTQDDTTASILPLRQRFIPEILSIR